MSPPKGGPRALQGRTGKQFVLTPDPKWSVDSTTFLGDDVAPTASAAACDATSTNAAVKTEAAVEAAAAVAAPTAAPAATTSQEMSSNKNLFANRS